MIQSALFQSPYSGCPWFSGWPKEEAKAKPAPWVPRTPQKLPGAFLAVDQYRPGWRERNPIKIAQTGLAPIQTRVCPVIPQTSFKECKGPSCAGPVTIRNPWYENDDFSSTNAQAGRLG